MVKLIRYKLKELLKKKGLAGKPYREIADGLGVDHVIIWKLLNGRPYNPSLKFLDKLCKALKCQPGDLLEYKKERGMIWV